MPINNEIHRADGRDQHGEESIVEPPTPRRVSRYRGAKLVVALALLAIAVAKLYHDRQGWAVVFSRRPSPQSSQPSATDFDLSQTTIPPDEVRGGGPPKDGIPALTDPEVIPADQAADLRADDRVVGLVVDGKARAYPLRILTWHEVVNDVIGGTPVLVSYCPLCDSVAAFDRRTPEGVKEFGVSGLLYQSNVLMYDRGGEPEALWSQLKAEAVSGSMAGEGLEVLPVDLTSWSDWRARHPETLVLSMDTGHDRDYGRDPYDGYFENPGLMFPVHPSSDLLPEKQKVLGVWAPDGTSKAFAHSAIDGDDAPRDVRDEVGGLAITVRIEPSSKSIRVVEADEGLEWMYALWFAWYAFHPETEVDSSR